jgi:hypothetical protein
MRKQGKEVRERLLALPAPAYVPVSFDTFDEPTRVHDGPCLG